MTIRHNAYVCIILELMNKTSAKVTPRKKQVKSKNGTKTRRTNKERFSLFLKFFVVPALIYASIFFILNPHHLGSFNRSFYLDSGDGFQNVWNIWWVNESITQLHQQPYYTDFLHYPHGVSLAGQTLNIFNGLLGIVLMNVFSASLVQATNIAVLLGFIGGGVTMFWLIQKLYKRYWISIFGGALFTFSSYHFAHGIGHLQLISLEWIPLFMLAFITLTEKLRWRDALYAGIALVLVGLCDYYYLLYSTAFAGLWTLYKLHARELQISWRNVRLFALFGAIVLAFLGPPIYLLLQLSESGKLLGVHDANMFSMDILSPFLPGGWWRWANLTEFFWKRLPGYYSETSVFFGYGLIALIAYAFFNKKRLNPPRWLNFWWLLFFVFGILSLGRHPRIYGHQIERIPLPYQILEALSPTFKLSGMPVRMILMSLLSGIVIACFVLTKLDLKTRKGRIILSVLVLVTIFDLSPKSLPLSPSAEPTYIAKLRTLPPGAIIDNGATSSPNALYYQTIHERKEAFGYISRLPESVDNKDFEIFADLEENRLQELCSQHGIRYVTTYKKYQTTLPVVYEEPWNAGLRIYDVKDSDRC